MKSKIKVLVGLIVIIIIFPLVYFFSSVPRTKINMLENGYVDIKLVNGKPVYKIIKSKPKEWKRLNQISKHTRNAIIVSEDWAFYQHEGVDSAQIKKAIADHFTKGEKLRGASTISQQLVKNLFLSNERTASRKLKEYFITKYLESRLSKDKIYEVYLNIIQYGKDLYGIENASQYYFKKNAGQLNAKEAAFLAMLLPSPVKYSQSFRDKKLSDFALSSINEILEKMKQANFLDDMGLEKAKMSIISWNGLPNKSRRKVKRANTRKVFNDGSAYENSYKQDSKLNVDALDYDDDAIVEDLSGLETEFQVDTD